MKKLRTHYENLQVAETASLEAIRGAYKYLSQRWHPDKNPDQRAQAERIIKMLNDAYAVLSDPARRAEHDRWIAAQRAAAERQAERELRALWEQQLGLAGKRIPAARYASDETPTSPSTLNRSKYTVRTLLSIGGMLLILYYLWEWDAPAPEPSASLPPRSPSFSTTLSQAEPDTSSVSLSTERALWESLLRELEPDPEPTAVDQVETVTGAERGVGEQEPEWNESAAELEPSLPLEFMAGRYRLYHSDYTAHAIIEDVSSGLRWLRCSVGQHWDGSTCTGEPGVYTWEEARELAAATEAARLPTIVELRTLVYCSSGYPAPFNSDNNSSCSGDYQRPTIVADAFPNTPPIPFWTTSFIGDGRRVWFTSFYSGHSGVVDKENSFRVRLVYTGL